jgi:RNA methyltransferase, TrmH family
METVNLKHLLSGFQTILMISKNKIKLIKSLAQKKVRQREQLFLVEGDKMVSEVLNSGFRVEELFATPDFIGAHKLLVSRAENFHEASAEEIKKASLLKTPQNCLAICRLQPPAELPAQLSGFAFYLDGIQDPGNLGTIVRTCDWFGIRYLFCSPDTANVFNPKVIQASMGSFCRVDTIYTPFEKIAEWSETKHIPIYGTFLEGENLYTTRLPEKALIVLGNEGKGICSEVANKIRFKLTIPSFSKTAQGAESLNVAVSAAIICSEVAKKTSLFKMEAKGKNI